MSKIYIVEDDAALCRELSELLQDAGYETQSLTDFANAREHIVASGADLILLDINIPHGNGELLLKQIRRECDTPVIMVTSRTSEADEVLSMSYGADDYITKPYHPAILLLRISAVLKRSTQSGQPVRSNYCGLNVNLAKGSLSDGTREFILTKNEMIIFSLLLDNRGRIVTRDQIMTALWDNNEFVNDNALTVNISRLRAKLAECGLENAIETRKKQGYILL